MAAVLCYAMLCCDTLTVLMEAASRWKGDLVPLNLKDYLEMFLSFQSSQLSSAV